MPYHGNYKVASHTRFNVGDATDLSVVLATHPGWLCGIQAFSLSSAGAASLFIYDTTAAVTTATVPIWQGLVPFAQVATSSNMIGGAGFLMDLAHGITLNNGLAYAVSSGTQSTATSTFPANLIKINLEYVTSSCL